LSYIFGLDYVRGPSMAALKSAGVKFVCRYLSTPGNPKNLRQTEATLLRSYGIQIVTVFETTANRALSGRAAGIADARAAQAQLVGLGAPVNAPVYFAVDFDATPAQQAAINAYLDGAASVLGREHVGVYGSFYVVERCRSAGVCKFFWQTYAWSGGQVSAHAHILQYQNGQRVGGASVDFDKAFDLNFGQWSPPISPKPPKPPITPGPKPLVVPKDDSFWTWLRWRRGIGEFEPYGPRSSIVRPNVPQRIPAGWWRALSGYLKRQPTA